MKLRCHDGATRDVKPACSSSTHASAACRRSIAKLVPSHTSRNSPTVPVNRATAASLLRPNIHVLLEQQHEPLYMLTISD